MQPVAFARPNALGDEVSSWAMVRIEWADLRGLQFEPSVIDVASSEAGSTVWVARTASDRRVGVAFGWARLCEGVLCVGDAAQMTTNALIFDGGAIASETMHLVYLANLIRQFGWEDAVMRRVAQ